MTSTTHSKTIKDSDATSMASNATFASTITLIKEKIHRSHKTPKAPKVPKAPRDLKEQPQKKLLLADVATGAHKTRMLPPNKRRRMLQPFIVISK